jgi:hypothetical protein
MLKIYLSSVIIWMVVIYCMTSISKESIVKNGWINTENKQKRNWFAQLFILSAVPIFRLFIVIAILCMAICTKEQFEQWKKEQNKDE